MRVAIKLMAIKPPVEVCGRNITPRSLQIGDIVIATKLFKGMKSFAKLSIDQAKVLKRWEGVFSDKTALGLSFRKSVVNYDEDFLKASADFDCAALDSMISLIKHCAPLRNELRRVLVIYFNHIANYERN